MKLIKRLKYYAWYIFQGFGSSEAWEWSGWLVDAVPTPTDEHHPAC